MKKALIAAAAIIVLSAIQSHARPGDPFTQYGCGRNTVAAGDPADKVLQYCGQPTSVQNQPAVAQQVYNRQHRRWESQTTRETEQWLYNHGPRGGMVQMNFRDGVLMSIIDKGAGY